MADSGRFPLDAHLRGGTRASRRLRGALRGPVEWFLAIETASGIVLAVASVVALVWANSPWAARYDALWESPVGVVLGRWRLVEPLHFWINEGLMTFFFLLAGYEIRRELASGVLSDRRRVALPAFAALGGMLLPVAVFLVCNVGAPTARGWAIPMATDVAFAVGLLALLGPRVPNALRVLLLALAVIDDLGAIVVIAVAYAGGIAPEGLLGVGAGLLVLAAVRAAGARTGLMYLLPLAVLWWGLHATGVHPSLAGVLVALAMPVRPGIDRHQFVQIGRGAIETFERRAARGEQDERLLEPLRVLSQAGFEAISPVVRAQARLHGFVAFVVLPLFALANAGVHLGGIDMSRPGAWRLALGIVAGLAIGKPLGVLLFSAIPVRLGLARLPTGIDWRALAVLASATGIGFTMSLLIAELAFAGGPLLEVARLSILVGSALAAAIGAFVGRRCVRAREPESTRAAQAERPAWLWRATPRGS